MGPFCSEVIPRERLVVAALIGLLITGSVARSETATGWEQSFKAGCLDAVHRRGYWRHRDRASGHAQGPPVCRERILDGHSHARHSLVASARLGQAGWNVESGLGTGAKASASDGSSIGGLYGGRQREGTCAARELVAGGFR